MPDSKCMVEKVGKEKCRLESTGIGVVEGLSVVVLAKSIDRVRKCNSCPKRNTKNKETRKRWTYLSYVLTCLNSKPQMSKLKNRKRLV